MKIPHEGCSTSKCLQVTEVKKGTLMYCHKCGYTKFTPYNDSITEGIKRKRVLKAQEEARLKVTYELPADFTQPKAEGLYWLGKGRWTQAMILKYNIGYSQSTHRVIIPLKSGYIARALEAWQKPKYIIHAKNTEYWETEGNLSTVAITEDVLSAGVLHEATGLKVFSLLGTTLKKPLFRELIKEPKKIIVWLDNDKAGISGSIKILSQLSLYDLDVQIIRGQEEPKNLCSKAINNIIKGLYE